MTEILSRWTSIDRAQIAQKGRAIYERIRPELEPSHNGEIVVIEVESGDYFLGRTASEANQMARRKYPAKVFYVARVGAPTYISYRR